MVRRFLESLFGGESRVGPPPKARLTLSERPAVTYAIGDVHGCLEELRQLEQMIVEDAAGIAGDKLIVMLGDYVDRGPLSAQVLDHLVAPPPEGFRRVALSGNHEQMMLEFLASPRNSFWLENGGGDTLLSFGIAPTLVRDGRPAALSAALAGRMSDAHRAFLAELPIMLRMPGFVFVHAGLRPGVALDRQSDEDLLWIRGPFEPEASGDILVHGHTPVIEAELGGPAIDIDTGACLTGRLTALRIDQSGALALLSTF